MANGKYIFNTIMTVFVSMAGWMFGADTGSIGGILNMREFQTRFANRYDVATDTYSYSPARTGLLVGMVNIGTAIGCILSSPFSDRIGKKISLTGWCVVYMIGNIIQIAAQHAWYQIMIGRIILGLGIGALSVVAPAYQSEITPPKTRGGIVASYQLFVTLGILIGNCVVLGTHDRSDSGCWRIGFGVNFIWAILLLVGSLFLPESPRFLMAKGRTEESRRVLASTHGCDIDDPSLDREFVEMTADYEAEMAGGSSRWIEIFSPTKRYRTVLGFLIMSFQQLQGANYFFYYGNTVFKGIGMTNSYIASLILSAVNFGCTIGALFVLDYFGRRGPLIVGGLWMFMCFMIYASVGFSRLYPDPNDINITDKSAGVAMIVFACLFILGFAMTWAPAAYVIIGESYPARVRSKCAAVATGGNWIWNFLISFFTPFITNAIGFKYGYVFAACCCVSSIIVYFGAMETKGLTLEEINTLYTSNIKPWQSGAWVKERVREQKHADVVNNEIEKRNIAASKAGTSTGHLENAADNERPNSFGSDEPKESVPHSGQTTQVPSYTHSPTRSRSPSPHV